MRWVIGALMLARDMAKAYLPRRPKVVRTYSPPITRSVINKHERRLYSQNGEDGIIEFIFSQIGAPNKEFVEFGVGFGGENNTLNLLLRGWTGTWMETDRLKVRTAKHYARVFGIADRISIMNTSVTIQNVNRLIPQTDFDFLSIDIDGEDFWVWKTMLARPRVVAIEYNSLLGTDAIVVPQDKSNTALGYYGASISALNKLALAKRYSLVGCDSMGVNAFFVRDDETRGEIVPMEPERAYYPFGYRGVDTRGLRDLPFVRV